MRKLRIVVRTARGALPLLVAASVAGCSDRELADSGGTGAGSGDGGATTTGADTPTGPATTDDGGGGEMKFDVGGDVPPSPPNRCDGGDEEEEITVELPPEGVPPEPGQICAVAVEPVESNRSALVRLTKGAGSLEMAQGTIEIDPAIEPRVLAAPVIEVVNATDPQLDDMMVADVARVPGGFTFTASWPQGFSAEPDGSSMLVRVTLDLSCDDPGETRTVQAMTYIYLCLEGDDVEWMSSGEQCVVCRDIFIPEMAPSPIVPDDGPDPLPLAKELRLRVVEVARVANTVVLLAENDGGEGLDYHWQASAGEIQRLAPDVIAWTVGDDDAAPLIQAAVSGPAAAAVASYAWSAAA